MKKKTFLNDKPFLKSLDKIKIKEYFFKAISLNFSTEHEIDVVDGLIKSGNINVDGSSAIRRTASLTVYCDTKNKDIKYFNNFFNIARKMKLFIGIKNTTDKYQDEEILWFPMGIFVITDISMTHEVSNGISISINLKDKMCLLNGEFGGVFPAAVDVDRIELPDLENGELISTKEERATMYQTIQELVNHWGGEQLGKIIINDLDTIAKKVRVWEGSDPGYLVKDDLGNYTIVTTLPVTYEAKYEMGDLIGYDYTSFTYPSKDYLTANAGESIVSVLDKIKNAIGNVEYFYDVDGNFVWQEIKNYQMTSKASIITNRDGDNSDYLMIEARGNSDFSFEDNEIISSYTNNPAINQIKNDFIIWGTYGEKTPIRYHLSIDNKPNIEDFGIMKQYEDAVRAGTAESFTFNNIDTSKVDVYNLIENINGELILPRIYDKQIDIPSIGEEGIFYKAKDTQHTFLYFIENNNILNNQPDHYYYICDNGNKEINKIYNIITCEKRSNFPTVTEETDTNIAYFNQEDNKYYIPIYQKGYLWSDVRFPSRDVFAADWRTKIYFDSVASSEYAKEAQPYFEELKTEWPNIYTLIQGKTIDNKDIYTGVIKSEFINAPYNMRYFLDFIDSSTEVFNQLNISNIGRRSYVKNIKEVNCLFSPNIDDRVIILNGDNVKIQQCLERYQPYIILSEEIYNLSSTQSNHYYSAYDEVKSLLYQYTTFNNSVTLVSLPIFYLEPNIRMTIRDADIDIYGDYMLKSFSIQLGNNNTMNLSCYRAIDSI